MSVCPGAVDFTASDWVAAACGLGGMSSAPGIVAPDDGATTGAPGGATAIPLGSGGAEIVASVRARRCLSSAPLVAVRNWPPVFSAMQLMEARVFWAFSSKAITWIRKPRIFCLSSSAVPHTSTLQLSALPAMRMTSSLPPWPPPNLAASVRAAPIGASPLGLMPPISFSWVSTVSWPGLARISVSAQFDALR